MTAWRNQCLHFGRFTCLQVCGFCLLSVLLAGCSRPNPPTSTVVWPSEAPTVPPATATPLPSETRLPSASPTATLTPLPSPTFTITPTALPWAQTVISAENAAQLTLLKSWDRGGIRQIERVGDDRVVVRSTTGVYVYRETGAELLSAFPDALQYRASPDASLVALNFPDGTLKVIDMSDGSVRFDIAPVGDLPDFQLQRLTEEEAAEWKRSSYSNASLVFSADSRRLAFAYIGGTIGVWDLQNGSLLAKLSHHVAEGISHMIFTPNGQNILALGMTASPLKILNFSIGESELIWYQSLGASATFGTTSPDGSLFELYMGFRNPVPYLYQLKEGALIGHLTGGHGEAPYSPDSTLMVTVNRNNVMVWQVQPKFQIIRTLYLDFPAVTAEFSQDGKELIINSGQSVFKLEDFSLISEGAPPPEPTLDPLVDVDAFEARGHLGIPIGLKISADQVLSVWGGSIRAWRWEPFTDRTEWIDFAQKPMAAPAISSDGGRIAACSTQDLAVYDFAGQELKTFERCLANGVLAFAPDGQRLVWAQGSNLHTVNPQDGSLIQDFIGSGLGITWLEFSEKSSLLASGGMVCGFGCTGDIHLWILDPPGGVSLEDENTDWVVTDVVFSPDEQWMYVAKRFIWLWDAKTGALKGRFPGEGNTLALSPDGSLLAVAEYGGNLRLMTTADRQEIASIQVPDDNLIDMLFTPDGRNLVTLSQAGAVRLWGIP